MTRRLLFLLLLLLPASHALAQAAVAVTVDDLPYAAVPAYDDATLQRTTARLLQQLQDAQVPAVGFVNEGRLYDQAGALMPARVALLERWLESGFELGNHTYSHVSLNRTPLDAFNADVLRGEAVTRRLMQTHGLGLRWFRHPYLHQGTSADVRAGFAAFLAAHGYRVAPVTVNNAEWVFASAYARALAQGDTDAAQRIGAAYPAHMAAEFARAEQLALDLFGRPIPHVLVLHANALNADHFGALADLLRQRGYRFVTLDTALQDAAYASPTTVTAFEGESWLECWARAGGLRPPQPPPVPGFVQQWAGSAAYRPD